MALFAGIFIDDKIVATLRFALNGFCEIDCNFAFRKRENKFK